MICGALPSDCAPVGVRKPSDVTRKMWCCRERPVCRSAPFKCNFPTVSIRWRREEIAVQIPLDGIWLVAAGIRSTEYGYIKIRRMQGQERKFPSLKFLKVLKTSFKKFSSRVWDRVPRSSPLPFRPHRAVATVGNGAEAARLFGRGLVRLARQNPFRNGTDSNLHFREEIMHFLGCAT